VLCQHARGIIWRFTATAIALSVAAHQSALHAVASQLRASPFCFIIVSLLFVNFSAGFDEFHRLHFHAFFQRIDFADTVSAA
jgi:hypothetical protein